MVRKCLFEEVEYEILGATLLSIDEVERIPREIWRDVIFCYDWWWLRSPGNYYNTVASVDTQGTVRGGGIYVYNEDMCVRPAFIIESHNLQVGDEVEFCGIKATVISEQYALVNEPIAKRMFDYTKNSYKKSKIKMFIDEWFDALKKDSVDGCAQIAKRYVKMSDIDVVGVTLLSADEAEMVPRETLKINMKWWLRSPGDRQDCATFVTADGLVNYDGSDVDYGHYCVRPAFIIQSKNLQIGDAVEIRGVKATVISDKYALVDKPRTTCWFDKEINNYERSYIKRFIDEWFDGLPK